MIIYGFMTVEVMCGSLTAPEVIYGAYGTLW